MRFLYMETRGKSMNVGHAIERIRISENIPLYQMCDILGLTSEMDYHKIRTGMVAPTIYQQIMVVINTRKPLEI